MKSGPGQVKDAARVLRDKVRYQDPRLRDVRERDAEIARLCRPVLVRCRRFGKMVLNWEFCRNICSVVGRLVRQIAR